MLQLPHCKKHSCALRAGHACRCVAVSPPPLQPPDWPAKVTARSARGRSLAVTCYWRHNLRRSSLHWTKRWTGLNLTLRVNDRYPKFWYFVKRPYWWISALGLKWMVWKFGTNRAKSEEVIAKKQGLTGSEIHSRCPPAVRSWRRAKIVGHLCKVDHSTPLCYVQFPEIKGFAASKCITTFQVSHHQEHSLNSISVPNLVSLAQNFLAPENPTSQKCSAPGACSLHPTGTATTKAHRLG